MRDRGPGDHQLLTGGEASRTRERARSRALLLLEHRERSVREMQQRLAGAGFQPEVVEEVLVWLSGLELLDDQRFASNYAACKRRSGWGPVRIRRELALKGVAAAVVEAALHPAEEGAGGGVGRGDGAAEVEESLVRTLQRKFAEAARQDPCGAHRRAAAFLARRGHPWPDIQRLVGRALGGTVEDGDQAP
ncbi:MAG: hypothetical protein GXX83_02210 [Gaiellales bacterium]|nr:hypothetical protein [Gaiellales bacterium]